MQQILIMFVFMAMGYIFARTGFFSRETIREMTGFVMYVVGSSVIINAFNRPVTPVLLNNFGMTAFAAVVLMGSSILISHFLFKFDRFSKNENISTYKFSSVYSNCGFMGIPLIEALLGADGTFFAIPYLAVFNILLWSHGIGLYEMTGNGKIQWNKVVKNPCIISSVLGFILFFFGVIYKMPNVVTKPVFYLASMNTPLSMIIIGANFVSITEPFHKDKMAWEVSFIRNILFPLIYIAILLIIPMNTDAKVATLAMASAPIAGVSVLFCLMFNKSTDFPSRALCLSTIFSVVTLPVIILIGSLIL
ncbi:malate transporter [Finegoldia magna]|uniref:Malate transporter n=1 Tax=Finegoldia magna TaxID=1260 RepID=A0A233V2A1_FINMA|nr:malate transporter [Finegoldia magna]